MSPWTKDPLCTWRFWPGPALSSLTYVIKVWPTLHGSVGVAVYSSADGHEDGHHDTYFATETDAVTWLDARESLGLLALGVALEEHYRTEGYKHNGDPAGERPPQ